MNAQIKATSWWTDLLDKWFPKPEIKYFTATPITIQKGSASLLKWETDKAKTVDIGPEVPEIPTTGEYKVSPDATTEYTLIATSKWYRTVEQKLSVTVADLPDPVPLPPGMYIGTGYDRNGDVLDPEVVGSKLQAAGLNACSIGFFGRDSNDFLKVVEQKPWLTKWLAAMRKRNILTLITATGTGGGNGGIANPKWTDAWFSSILDVMVELGPQLVMFTPVCEGNIKEGASEPAKSKIINWYNMTTARLVGWKLGWNYQCVPTAAQVPAGWAGIYHPQNWDTGVRGQICHTDAGINPPINSGTYPNQNIIPERLTGLANKSIREGKSFIYWGQWEKAEIEQAAIDAVSAAITKPAPGCPDLLPPDQTPPTITSIGAEEVMGTAGRLHSIAVDMNGQPHVASDGGSFLHMYDKINGAWSYSSFNAASIGSNQFYNPHIELRNNKSWVSGILMGNTVGIGVLVRNNITTAPSAPYFTQSRLQGAWDAGNLSIDMDIQPEGCAVSSSRGYWKWYKYDETAPGKITEVSNGIMYANNGGEKNSFIIGRGPSMTYPDNTTHKVWHGGTDTGYQNSFRQAKGMPFVLWADWNTYKGMWDDGAYPGIGYDARNPLTAYFAHALTGQGGILLNVWKGNMDGTGTMVRPTNSLFCLDSKGTSGLRRYAPQFAPAKTGGAFLCWTRNNQVIVRYIAPNGGVGNENIICTGTQANLCTDADGNIHLVYNNGKPCYRKITVIYT